MTDISQKQGGWTPGTWRFNEIDPEDKDWGACEVWPVSGDDQPVATMVCGVSNARLIAAAPDLAAVSQRVAVRQIDGAWYVTIFGDDGGFWSARLPDDMIAPAREFEVARQSALSRANPSTGQGEG